MYKGFFLSTPSLDGLVPSLRTYLEVFHLLRVCFLKDILPIEDLEMYIYPKRPLFILPLTNGFLERYIVNPAIVNLLKGDNLQRHF